MSEFKNLHLESIYLQGARDILLRLRDDFDMYLIPSIKCRVKKSEFLPYEEEPYEWFPLSNTKTRKIVGKALLETLLYDRISLVRFIQGDYRYLEVKSVERDKKGKITNLKIEVV